MAYRQVLFLLMCVGALALTGCAATTATSGTLSSSGHPAVPETAAPCAGPGTSAEGTRLTAIEQLLAEGKPYAALAQLDAGGLPVATSTYLRAEALRRVGKSADAATAYETLLGSCWRGQAHHGLGLLAAQSGDLPRALRHLETARQSRPTDARVRNDLGYALLLSGDLPAARLEFLTALDLQPDEARAARNLVLLAFRQGDDGQARALAGRFGLDATVIAALRRQAQALAVGAPA